MCCSANSIVHRFPLFHREVHIHSDQMCFVCAISAMQQLPGHLPLSSRPPALMLNIWGLHPSGVKRHILVLQAHHMHGTEGHV